MKQRPARRNHPRAGIAQAMPAVVCSAIWPGIQKGNEW